MAKEINVYREWLGVSETARPLNYYQLLRLKAFEDDRGKIREHYRKINAHVHKFADGEYAQQAHDLLGELTKAMLCLTDVVRKDEYDASLGRQRTGGGRRRSFEEILLASKSVDQAQLAKARSYAQAVGLEVREALVQQKAVSPETMMLAYAESVGLPFIDLDDVGVDEALAPAVPPTLARQHSCVPVMADHGHLLMASPNPLAPDVEEELRLRFSLPVRTVLCTPAGVNAAVAKYYPRDAMRARRSDEKGRQARESGGRRVFHAGRPSFRRGAQGPPHEVLHRLQHHGDDLRPAVRSLQEDRLDGRLGDAGYAGRAGAWDNRREGGLHDAREEAAGMTATRVDRLRPRASAPPGGVRRRAGARFARLRQRALV